MRLPALLFCASLFGCETSPLPDNDAGRDAAIDAGVGDAGAAKDAGVAIEDAGMAIEDAGVADAGPIDGGTPDAGPADAGTPCEGYDVVRVALQWNDAGFTGGFTTGYQPSDPSFPADSVLSVSFRVPSNAAPSTAAGRVSVAEYSGPPTVRWLTLSARECDFTAPLSQAFGTTATVSFSVSNPALAQSLTPGATYFLSVRNYDLSAMRGSCFISACNLILDASAPRP